MSLNQLHRSLSDVQIKIDGVQISADILGSLLSVRVQQQLSSSAQAEIIFHNQLAWVIDDSFFVTGVEMQISIKGDSGLLFSGQITVIEHVFGPAGERLVHVRGNDSLHLLNKQQHVRSHVRTNIRSLAKEWISSIGLELQTDVSPPDWNWKIQYQQADWEWLSDLSHQQGYYFHVHNQVLYLFTLAGTGPEIEIKLGENLREARLTQNSQYSCDGVHTTGWNASEVAITSGYSGVQIKKKTVRTLTDDSVTNKMQADKVAQAVFDRCKAGENSFWGIAEGETEFYPGRKLKVYSFPKSITRKFTLTSVTHSVNAERGFITELSTAPPVLSKSSYPSAKAVLGIVSNIDDPERAGRIKVSLPTYNDTESDWLHVTQPAAGKNKGLLSFPSCGDQVVLLPLADDPAQSVVLGGLYGMDNLPDDKAVSGDNVTRYAFMTPKGQYLRFDEQLKSTTLRSTSGSYIKLSPSKAHIHAATDLILEAPGKKITIKAAKVDFEKG